MEFYAAIKIQWIRAMPDALEEFPWLIIEWENGRQESVYKMIQAYVLCRVRKYLYLCVTLRIWRQIWKTLFKGSKGISSEREGGMMWGRKDWGGEQKKKKGIFLGLSSFIGEIGIKIPIVFLSQIPVRISWDDAKVFENVQGSAQICDGGIYYNV